MSNPLDPIVETLRAAEPRPEATERAVAALRRPHPPRLVPLAAGVAILSTALLWPHGSAGMAWAQIADQDLPLRFHETRTVVAGGQARTTTETWVDRPADASRSVYWVFRDFPAVGRSVASNPLSRRFEYVESPRGFYGNSNGFASFTRKPLAKSRFDPRLALNVRRRTGLAQLLESKDVQQQRVERDVETRVGRADRYTLVRSSAGSLPFEVYVQAGTKRVLGCDTPETSGDLGQLTFEYPDRFPAGLFDIPPKGSDAYDLDALNARVEARLAKPIAPLEVGGQRAVLRLVAQDKMKELWVFWSGARPNGDLAHRARVLGLPNGAAHSSLPYVSKGFNGYFSPFGGHSITLNRRVNVVDLSVPVFEATPGRSRFVGDVTVRHVPVLQLPFVDGLSSLQRRALSPAMTGMINSVRRGRSGGTGSPRKP